MGEEAARSPTGSRAGSPHLPDQVRSGVATAGSVVRRASGKMLIATIPTQAGVVRSHPVITSCMAGVTALVTLAHQPVPLRGEPSCPPCRIVLVEHAVLKSRAADVVPSTEPSLARVRDGGYVVSHRFGTPALLLYDRRGRLLRTYERRGSGPGEFSRAPRLYLAPGGELRAFAGNRLLHFTTSLEHVKTANVDIAPTTRAIFFDDGWIAVEAPVQTDDGATLMLHFLNGDGKLQRSAETTSTPTLPLLLARSDHGVWVGSRNNSTLRLYSQAGKLVRLLELRRPVFEAWTGTISGENVTQRPRARNSAITERNRTSLVILTYVPDPKWSSPFPGAWGTHPRLEGASLNSLDGGKVWDTVLQVVDSENGAVLAIGQSPHMLMVVEGAVDEFYYTEVHEDGSVSIRILRLELRHHESDT
jgi:hypothetical protein